jgi:acyl-CoA hydrolase
MRLVLCAEGPCEPSSALTSYLEKWPASLSDPVHILFGMRRTPPPITAAPDDGLTVGSLMPGRGLRWVSGLRYHRLSYTQVCAQLQSGELDLDAVIACSTAVLPDGTRSLGAVNGYLQIALDAAPRIVLEEVAWLPTIPGSAIARRWDQVVPSDIRPQDLGPPLATQFDDVDEGIADRIADLVGGEGTFSLGIGRIPSALAHRLRGESLTLVCGAVTESVRDLYDSIPGSSRQPIRAMSVVGPSELLDWASREDRVELLPSTIVHNPTWLAKLPKFVAIMGALSIDRFGNVNSETVGERLVSGIGGAPDFALGAHLSPTGKCVVALRAQVPGRGPVYVDSMATATIPSNCVDTVVTELGLLEVVHGRDVEYGDEIRHLLGTSL